MASDGKPTRVREVVGAAVRAGWDFHRSKIACCSFILPELEVVRKERAFKCR